jgi:two-component system response regulator PilR (NtrC family)
MPPLRQRQGDIPELAKHMVRRWSGGRVRLSADCLNRLSQLALPGNVRELENLLQRMLALSEGDDLDAELLAELYSGASNDTAMSLAGLQKQYGDLDRWMDAQEQRMIEEALAATGGNITRAAEELGISFRSLRYRLKKLGFSGEGE